MELFAADGHDAGGCERVTGKSGMRPFDGRVAGRQINRDMGQQFALDFLQQLGGGYGQQQANRAGR